MPKYTLDQALSVFGSKAPVNGLGPKRQALAAYDVIRPHLLADERQELQVALSHAECGDGRQEFDDVWARVRARLKR